MDGGNKSYLPKKLRNSLAGVLLICEYPVRPFSKGFYLPSPDSTEPAAVFKSQRGRETEEKNDEEDRKGG